MDEVKYNSVEQWLTTLYGDDPVPQYEIDPISVDTLYSLYQNCERADQFADCLIEDLEKKVEEYAAETRYLNELLGVMRLKPEDLSTSAQGSVRTLVDLALSLNIKDTSDTSYLLAMTSLSRDVMKMADSRKRVLYIGGQFHEKTKAALKKAALLEKTVSVLEEQCELQAKSTASRLKEAKFMRGKAREYNKTIHSYQSKLPASYVSHQQLVNKAEELRELNEKLAPLKSRLNGYHSLPPNMNLARVKIEETKREIAAVEEDLAKIVSQI